MRKLVIFVLILVAIPVVWYWVSFPTVSYRYRLSIAVESDGQVHSGSSVIEVQYQFYPKFLSPIFGVTNERIWGQAVLIDLGARGALVAALHSGTGSGHVGVNADVLAARAFDPAGRSLGPGYPSALEKLRAVSQMRGHVDLTTDNLPPFIWFSDLTNPETARLLNPADFAGVIGDAARLQSAQVEMTTSPIFIDLDKRLPWYGTFTATNGVLKADGILLGYTAFIGNGTLQ